MHVIVKRSQWGRGVTGGYLYIEEKGGKKFCFLGFVGLAAGVPEEDMQEEELPCNMEHFDSYGKWPEAARTDELWVEQVSEVNDDNSMSDEIKEKRLAAIALRHGLVVQFID